MPGFAPFSGVRYDPALVRLADVTAPPYDVVDAEERSRLSGRSPYNVVRIDLPLAEPGVDRYAKACRLFHGWLRDGVLRTERAPAFYGYRMTYEDELGRPRHTTGVIGALDLVAPGEGGILPHEQTHQRARSDRLTMLRTCRANLSPVWLLSLAAGLTARCAPETEPVDRWVDEEGVGHELWVVDDPAAEATIAELVGSAPLVIADGHHRYETSLAYRDERHAEGAGPGPWDRLMAFVVELAEDELDVHPIHRLLSGLPDDLDLVAALAASFDAARLAGGEGDDPVGLAARLPDLGGLGLLTAEGAWLLRPRHGADVDSGVLAGALAALPDHVVRYHHSPTAAAKVVRSGDAQAAVLLRPVPVPRIADAARAGERFPPKTTFFAPKPRTGLVFMNLDADADA
ncbi:MAG TPA: DUF1015 domain-containing protein [Acidimicrobiales bacterium]